MRVAFGIVMLLGCLVIVAANDTAARSVQDSPKPAPVAAGEEVPLEGYYACEGTLPGDDTYTSMVSLRRLTTTGNVYVAFWYTDTTVVGVGILEKGRLSVAWTAERVHGDPHVMRGVSVMTVRDGKHLSGTWATLPGDGVPQEETWTFVAPPGKPKMRL